MNANNYEIRLLQKGNWTTETSFGESNAAITLANQFAMSIRLALKDGDKSGKTTNQISAAISGSLSQKYVA
ncbi:MAG: hypothetical protein ACPGPC_00710 [Alphaproteobacteria bacterium]